MKRYELEQPLYFDGGGATMTGEEHGDWVTFEEANKRILELEKQLSEAHENLKRIHDECRTLLLNHGTLS